MKEKLVSVIVPVYNAQDYIHRCVTSILNQTYTNIEVLLIVDGATDGSAEICRQLSETDRRILLVEKENEGVSATRNLGITMAKGDYICFVDSDDSIAQDYVESLLSALTKTDAQIVLCDYCFENSGNYSPSGEPELWPCDLEKENICHSYVRSFFRIDGAPYVMGSACRSMFQRALLEEKDIRFPPCKLFEDQLFVLSAMAACERIAVVNRAMYYYNDAVSDSAVRRKYKGNLLADQLVYLKYLEALLRHPRLQVQQQKVRHYALLNGRKLLLTNAVMNPAKAARKKEIRQIRKSRIWEDRIPFGTYCRWLRAQPIKSIAAELLLRLRLYGAVRWLRNR